MARESLMITNECSLANDQLLPFHCLRQTRRDDRELITVDYCNHIIKSDKHPVSLPVAKLIVNFLQAVEVS